MFQAKALANAVFAYASNIDDLGKLTDAIGIIAQKHVSFQVPPNSYQDVGTELLKSIKEILGKVIYPKYSKHWLYFLASSIESGCSKINHGLFLWLFKFNCEMWNTF